MENKLDFVAQKKLDFYSFLCRIFYNISRHFLGKSVKLLEDRRLEGDFAKEYYKFIDKRS